MGTWVDRNYKYHEGELDFDNIGGDDTIKSKSLIIQHKLNAFKNPFIGNKRKLIYQIVGTIEKHNIKYDTVLDLFCGSGFFSMAMKLLDKKVICNDIMISAYTNAVAFVANCDIVLTKEEKKFLAENKRNEKIDVFFEKYKDKFTDNEIRHLQDYYYNLEELYSSFRSDGLAHMKRSLAFAYIQNYIIENCFVGGRLNNGKILANLEHRLQHPRNNGQEMSFKAINIKWNKPIYPNDTNRHQVFCLDAIDFLRDIYNGENKILYEINPDLCYIDPPYGGDQSNYPEMYEFLEEYHYLTHTEERDTIYDHYCEEAKLSMKKKIEGKKRFIHSKNYKEHFDELISLTNGIPWIVVSYNNSSWGNLEQICEVIKKYRKEIIVEEFSYSYKYRKKGNKDKGKEYLILAKE